MSRVRDRTEDFKEALRVAALSHGYTEVSSNRASTSPFPSAYGRKPNGPQFVTLRCVAVQAQMAALMSSFIIRKSPPKSPFTNAAIKTVGVCGGCVPVLLRVGSQVARVIDDGLC